MPHDLSGPTGDITVLAQTAAVRKLNEELQMTLSPGQVNLRGVAVLPVGGAYRYLLLTDVTLPCTAARLIQQDRRALTHKAESCPPALDQVAAVAHRFWAVGPRSGR